MANNVLQVKRTSTSGRTPNTTASYATNTQYIAAGEFALNMADGILYSSNGTAVITVGANLVNQRITGTLTVNAISANGGVGTAGQALSSNGSSVYWGTVAQATANLTLYTSGSGTWTKPSVGTFAKVRMWGGGGSGAHGGNSASPKRESGGGGGGRYAERLYLLTNLGATESYSVGAGGIAISANTNGGVNGNPGGTSTFSTSTNALNAYGGGGGGNYTGTGKGGDAASLFAQGGTGVLEGSSVDASQPWAGGTGGFSSLALTGPGIPGKGYFGGGGGGAYDGASNQAGATSVGGGAGGTSGYPGSGTDGSAPGGGGGACGNGTSTSVTSGAGGAGRIEIWVW